MIRTARLLIAICIFSVVARAQGDPLAWFPLQVGSHWVYEHEAKSGDRNLPDVDRWRTEQTITGWVTIPEGVVVLREVKEKGSSPQRTVRVIEPDGRVGQVQEPEYNRKILTARDRQPYLVRGNCLYVVSGGWDTQTQQLRPEYRKFLIEGTVSPDFCFPLRVGQKWGNLKDTPWRIERARDNVGSFLPSEYAGAIRIFSDHFGSGGWEDVWFQKGVGVVGEHYIHNGTYDEYTKKLVSR
jgi:hypothetical protein